MSRSGFEPAPDAGRRRGLAVAAASLLLPGCTLLPDRDHDGPDAPQALPLKRPVRTAWVFSSGGPRGFVHVGVLRALDRLQLAPDLIVGASAGALVGGLFAAGMSAIDIETLALDLDPISMVRLTASTDWLLSGTPLAGLVNRLAPVRRMQDMPIAMACVAARLPDRQAVAFTHGEFGLAVQASTAIEDRFTPVRIRGTRYVDADWVAPLPVRVARALGAQRVIAVDATVHLDRAPSGALRYREGDLRKQALVQADARLADLVIKPDFGYWVNLSRDFREHAAAAGLRETLAMADALRALHAAHRPSVSGQDAAAGTT